MKTGELAPTALEVRVLRLLRALANPARFHIVALLAERKGCTAVHLAETLPLAQSSLFDHLRCCARLASFKRTVMGRIAPAALIQRRPTSWRPI